MKKVSFAKKTLALAAASLLAMPVLATWTVKEGKLLDPNGNPFIFRGATIDSTLDPEKTLQAIQDIAAAGANAVQVEINANLYNQASLITGEQLRAIINACKTNKVVCVLEPNDVAGYPDFANAGIPSTAAVFWNWPGIRESIIGQHDYIILGFGNQALSPMPAQEYVARMQTYLREFSQYPLRAFVVMIDGSNWSQDNNKAMLEFAKQTPNTGAYLPYLIYSVDMFDAYLTPESVHEYISSFTQAGFPLVIGGFAPTAYYHPNNTSPRPAVVYDLPEDAVMQYAEQYGAGYFGWSWSGNNNPALDLVSNWNPANLTPWGNLLFNGANGIQATAKPASIFSGSSSSGSHSSVPVNQPPVPIFSATNYPITFCNGPEATGRITATGNASFDPNGDSFVCSWTISGGASTSASACDTTFPSQNRQSYELTLTVTDSKGASAKLTKIVAPFYVDCPSSSSRSSSSVRSSSSIPDASSPSSSSRSSSSVRSSSSSVRTSSSSSVAQTKAQCSYLVQSQWGSGFTASIRIKNTTNTAINGWDVNWQYADGSKVTNLWNATLSGSNPYNAKNLSWNSSIQPGQTVEFGFQGSKPAATATVPVVTGSVCQ